MTQNETNKIAKKLENLGSELESNTSNIIADINNVKGEVLNLQMSTETKTTKGKTKSIKLDKNNLSSLATLLREHGVIERKQLNSKHPETDVIDREAFVVLLKEATGQDWQCSRIGTMFVVE